MNKDTKSKNKVKPKISPLYKNKRFVLITFYLIFYLFYTETPEKRHSFLCRHKVLNRLYVKMLKEIGRSLVLPVKRCSHCGISFIPDYRTYRHQRHCPYGCIAFNRKQRVKEAKKRYRADLEVLARRAEYNRQYRIHGRLSGKDEHSAMQSSVCLRRQLLYIVRRLNPGMSQAAIARFERRLKRIEVAVKIEGDTILRVLRRTNYLKT